VGVNKAFVVKNGLEVKSNLLLADVTKNSVGIGTSVINYKLHVLGGIGATNIYVSGGSTITDLSGSNITYATGTFGTGIVTSLSGSNLNYSGIATVGSLYVGSNEVVSSAGQLKNIVSLDATTTSTIETAIANAPNTFTNLVVTGVSTLGVTTVSQLYSVGIVTASSFVPTSGYIKAPDGTDSFYIYSGTGNVAFQGTIGASQLNSASGNKVIGLSANNATFENDVTITRNLTVSGIATIGTVRINAGIVTAATGIVTYYGDGSKLTNILSGVGVATAGGTVGTGATILDFRGAGISTVTVSAGIATINITGGGGGGSIGIGSVFPVSSTNGSLFYHIDYGRTFVYYDEVALGIGATAVWVDSAPFNQGGLYVNKYGDNMFAGLGVTTGSLTNPSVYFNGFTNSGFYSPAPNEFGVVVSGTQRLNVNSGGVSVTGIITASEYDITGSTNSLTSGGLTVGIATATSFRGSAQVGVATGGTFIGLTTQFNFVGSGVAVTHAYNSTAGITTVTITAAPAAAGGSGLFNTGITSSVGYAVTTTMATAYTAPATAGNEHIVHSIHVTNIDGTNSADVSGQMYAGAFSIAHLVPVPAGSSVELLKQPKILAPSETIQLQASANSRLHATITIETKVGDTSYVGVGTDITSAATYTDLWTATANSMLQGILLANDDGTADVKARVVWTDGANNIIGYYAYDMVIPADATVEVLEQPKYLPSGYKVRVYANQANRLEAILSARTIV
jgi:hypothetical protein